MNVYFDTEFTGLDNNAQLISIGMITETGVMFYAEFDDYKIDNCSDWVIQNVITNTYTEGDCDFGYFNKEFTHTLPNEVDGNLFIYGDSNLIKEALTKWFSQFDKVQLISDVCHYDMTLLCNLFGGAFNLPENVNPVCYDICQDVADWLMDLYADDEGSFEDYMKKAFDISREKIINKVDSSNKHNALYDAIVIKDIYHLI